MIMTITTIGYGSDHCERSTKRATLAMATGGAQYHICIIAGMLFGATRGEPLELAENYIFF